MCLRFYNQDPVTLHTLPDQTWLNAIKANFSVTNYMQAGKGEETSTDKSNRCLQQGLDGISQTVYQKAPTFSCDENHLATHYS